MRIAIIAPPWVPVPPPAYGGTENVLDTLARGLQAAGHDVLLYATGDSTCPVPTEWTFDEALGTVETGAASELLHAIQAYRRILEWDADVVHDHTLVGPVYSEWLDVPGHPITSAASMTERITRPNYGTLNLVITVDDPKAYTRPWTVDMNMKIMIDTQMIDEFWLENEKDSIRLVGPSGGNQR